VVGLPIDSKNHDKGNAAGWIIKAELIGDVIRFTPVWTALGIELIGENLQRFFSPTVDMTNKTVTGGSLTNWPATRSKGKNLLKPIELAEGDTNPMEEMLTQIKEMLAAIWEKMNPKEEPKPEEAAPTEPAQEMAQSAALSAQLAQAQAQVANLTAQFERKARVVEFAKRVTTGATPTKRGLNMPAAELAEVLLSLPDDTAAKVQTMLESLVVVDFGERGHDGRVEQKQELPALIKPYLSQWIAAGKTAETFFSINPELGKMADFNLSEFQKEK
jgi:hypothetical protein